jgi:hypothetical protein
MPTFIAFIFFILTSNILQCLFISKNLTIINDNSPDPIKDYDIGWFSIYNFPVSAIKVQKAINILLS